MSKAGDDLEKIVELIEKSISPDAMIEQNVNLPVIASPTGRKRQCDVVITSGSGARQTVSIVEVQDRTSKVSIGTFSDWLVKLDEVGANRLICISRQEFPESIKEKAMLQGSRVLLINLKQSLPDELPVNMISFEYAYENLNIENVANIQCVVAAGTMGLKDAAPNAGGFDDKIWSTDKHDSVSLREVIEPIIKEANKEVTGIVRDRIQLSFQNDKRLILHFPLNDDYIRVGISLTVDYVYDNHHALMPVSSYEQLDTGVLAWVFEGELNTSQGKLTVKLPIVASECGAYKGVGVVNSTEFATKLEIIEKTQPKRKFHEE